MPGILRLNDIDNAGDKMIESSSKVFVNDVGVCFEGHMDNHDSPTSGDKLVDISSKVFVEGKGVGYIGGKDKRGNQKIAISGSANVDVGI